MQFYFKPILKRRSFAIKWMWRGSMHGIVFWDFASHPKTLFD